MKTLSLEKMENHSGGAITQGELDTFFGVATCVLAVSSLVGALFGGYGCYQFLSNL